MKVNFWNIIFAAIVTAFLGCLGYLLTSISDLQKKEAAREALEFTSKDAIILQQKLTDVMTDIDLRISLIERDIQWVKMIQSRPQSPIAEPAVPLPPADPPTPSPDAQPNAPMPPMPSAETQDNPRSPRYDFRQQLKR